MSEENNGTEPGAPNAAPETGDRPDPQQVHKAAPDAATAPSPLPELEPLANGNGNANANGKGNGGANGNGKSPAAPAGAIDALTAGLQSVDSAHFDVVMDIPVRMSVEVGRADISLRHLVQLGHGSLVELDRPATAPLDIRVNGVLIARGEVVVVNDEKMGIRVTDVVSQAERLKRLR
jgi:flagellar motor switch protein FliN/FliY